MGRLKGVKDAKHLRRLLDIAKEGGHDSSNVQELLREEKRRDKAQSEAKAEHDKWVNKGARLPEHINYKDPGAEGTYKDKEMMEWAKRAQGSAGEMQRANALLSAMREGPSLAVMAGEREKQAALSQLGMQEARNRDKNAALAALYGDRTMSGAMGGLSSAIAQNRSGEVGGMTDRLAGNLGNLRGRYESMGGVGENDRLLRDAASKEWINQLKDESLQRKLANELGIEQKRLVELGKPSAPSAFEQAMNIGGQIGGGMASVFSAYKKNQNEVQPYFESPTPGNEQKYNSPFFNYGIRRGGL